MIIWPVREIRQLVQQHRQFVVALRQHVVFKLKDDYKLNPPICLNSHFRGNREGFRIILLVN